MQILDKQSGPSEFTTNNHFLSTCEALTEIITWQRTSLSWEVLTDSQHPRESLSLQQLTEPAAFPMGPAADLPGNS